MEALSLIALILLSLVGYSAGAVLGSRRVSDPQPGIFDLVLIAAIWVGAVYIKMHAGINRWLLILIFAASACVVGWAVSLLRQGTRREAKPDSAADDQPAKAPSLWKRWNRFSKKMGGFQSRAILSFFYFFVVLPFALAVRLFSDPLSLRRRRTASHWSAKKSMASAEDSFRKQF
jgi:hypothetical protein